MCKIISKYLLKLKKHSHSVSEFPDTFYGFRLATPDKEIKQD